MKSTNDAQTAKAGNADATAPMPTLSVVIATMRESGEVADLLQVVAPNCRNCEAQLIVAAPARSELEDVRKRFPEALFVAGSADADFAELRYLATGAASGDILILSDDTRPLPEEWLTTQ
jgi:hypothetical protein